LFFPSSTDIRQVDVHGGYTAAAGHAFYTSDRFPAAWRDGRMAFVTEPTGKLVGQFEITREGAGFKARQLPNNLFDSADAWTSPVFAETGPDGAVWICDWYNLIIQHNPTPSVASAGVDAENGRGNAYETPLRDTRHGRIYRVYPSGTADDKNPGLDPADPGTLIAALEHPNQFWRIEAQRLLVETRSATATAKLREIVKSGSAYAALHAFGALQGLGALDDATVKTALASPHRGLRRVAIAEPMAVPFLTATFTRDGALAAADDRELAELLAALSRQAASAETGRLLFATLAKLNPADAVLADAWQIAARSHAAGVLLAAAQAGGASNPQVAPLVAHFSEKGDSAAKNALAAALAGRTDAFSQELITKLNAAPVEKKEVVRKHTPDPVVHERGLVVYNKTCVACHGPEGKGVPMAFPPLDGSERLTGDPSIPTRIVLHGLHGPLEAGGAKFNTVMAPLNILTDAEIADVLTYARQSWKNDGSPVKAEEVSKVRAQYADRNKPWTVEELK
jgi:mono/diheme cytochrome c family protein